MNDSTDFIASEVNFSQLNQQISTRIYQRFVSGKIITRQRFHDVKSMLVDDADYTYLFRYVKEFTLFYALMGKNLVHHVEGEFFYIDNIGDADIEEADEHALRTQSILLILARYFELSGRNLSQLSEPSLGFSESDIAALTKNEEYQAICKALKFASWTKAIEYLVNRGFAFATSPDTYMLSSAGAAFCLALIDAYDAVR